MLLRPEADAKERVNFIIDLATDMTLPDDKVQRAIARALKEAEKSPFFSDILQRVTPLSYNGKTRLVTDLVRARLSKGESLYRASA